MSRPSLKIIRYQDRMPAERFTFEVWNPITGAYESMGSIAGALSRLIELAEQVRVMWVQQDQARLSLKDVPAAREDDNAEWAELRVSARAKWMYWTRNFDLRAWTQARGRNAAIQTICNEVGYVPP